MGSFRVHNRVGLGGPRSPPPPQRKHVQGRYSPVAEEEFLDDDADEEEEEHEALHSRHERISGRRSSERPFVRKHPRAAESGPQVNATAHRLYTQKMAEMQE